MWTDDKTIYHIYPLGLCGAPVYNDGQSTNRINKILNFLPHLENLGIGGIYFGPIFESDKHGYDTRDYFKTDARLGEISDFKEVFDAIHQKGIKIILDGVFNHVGRGFWAFKDVIEKKWDSPYKDWFILNFDSDPYGVGFWYDCWEGHPELVKLNLCNRDVKKHIFDAVKFWIENFDIDGLRLDVAYCLDRGFMSELRQFVKSIKGDFVLIGEVLFGDYNLIVNDNMLDSCTNYENYKSLYSAFNSRNLFEISYSLNRQFGPFEWCIYKGKHLMTFLDNHDVTRFKSILTDKELVNVGFALQLTTPGIPCIYYGSEWGIEGDKAQGDESLRPAVDKPEFNELTAYIKKLIDIRKSNYVFSFGGYKNIVERNEALIFERKSENQRAIVAINIGGEIKLAAGELYGDFTDAVTSDKVSLCGELVLPAKCATVLLQNY